jgi:hypothetical protein
MLLCTLIITFLCCDCVAVEHMMLYFVHVSLSRASIKQSNIAVVLLIGHKVKFVCFTWIYYISHIELRKYLQFHLSYALVKI